MVDLYFMHIFHTLDLQILLRSNLNPGIPKLKKKKFLDPQRINAENNQEIPSLKTPDPCVPIKVLPPTNYIKL